MITIVDYGLGNIKAFANGYEKLNIPITIANNADVLKNASKIILPGVGAFDYAMTRLNNSGLRDTLDELVLNKNTPILGICVGLQILAQKSAEGELPGLGWIDGEVVKFDASSIQNHTQLPHMGWNTIILNNNNKLLNSLTNRSRFYFLHSYYFKCNDENNIIATTEYGAVFTSVVNRDNIYGVQFHPEKSHHNGAQLLKNFADL